MFQNLKKDQKNKGLKKINSKRKGVKNSLSFVFLLIFSIIFSCSFVDIVKADVLNSYSKVLGDTLTATEWNNLNSDFLKSYTSDTMEGVLNILLTGGSNAELKIQSIGGENQHWGIYHDRGTEDLRFWNNNITGEKNLLTLTNDGKVGVGTTTPAYTLDVEGTINADNLYIGGTPFSGGLWSAVGADIYYNSGNVGIGTTTPSEVLDVVGKISINNGGNSVFLGEGAGFSDIAGSFSYSNIGIGYQALYNSQGHDNSANGYRALYTNVWGSHNTANGSNSLYFNTDNYNTANGSNSLYSNTTGSHNTASGYNSLSSNTTGRYNIAIGSYSGMLTVNGGEGDSYYRTGDGGVFLGYNTKPLNDGDQNEIVIGYNTTGLGSNSVVLGNNDITKTILKGSVGIGTTNPNVSVGLDVQEGTGHSILAGNLKIGNVATPEATTDAVNKAYVDDNFIPSAGGTGGAGAGFVQGGNTFGTAAVLGTNDNYGLSFETNGSVKMNISPTGNVGIGIGTVFASNSLEVNGRLKLYNGVQGKIFIGNMAGEGNLSTGTGDYNIAIGDYALHDNSDGDRNIAIGSQSLYSNTASRNIAIGADSLQINYTGASNTAIGVQSLTSNWSGLHNIAIGDNALGGNSSGSYNIALGNYAGQSIISGANNQTGNYNLFLGYDTRPLADGDQNEIVIGYNATGIGSNSVVLGNDSITKTVLKGSIGIGTSNPDSANLEIYDTGGYALYANGLTIGGVGTPSADDDAVNKAYVDDNFSLSTNAWALDGNTLGSKKTLGSIDNYDIGFITNNTERLTIDTEGNVGIGVSNPSSFNVRANNLVVGTGAGSQGITIYGGNGEGNDGSYLVFADSNVNGSDKSGSIEYYHPDDSMRFFTNASQRLMINSSGNVGIGTTDPVSSLHVVGDTTINGTLYLGGNFLDHPHIENDSYDTVFYNSNAERMRIDSLTGNIGIGTSTPAAALDVQSGSGHSILAGSMKIGNVATPVDDTDAANKAYVDGLTGADTDWTISGSNMYSGVSGNVGIGTNSPAYKLDIVGKLGLDDGGNSVFIGTGAGANDDGTTNSNIGIGYESLNSNTTGSYNTANGSYSLFLNTTGSYNTSFGFQALRANNGLYNTAVGYRSLFSNNSGGNNIASGYQSLYSNTTGGQNSAIGREALHKNTTGSYNISLGYQAGSYIADGSTSNTTGDYNIFLGTLSKALADNDQNEIVIGYNATGVGSNSVVLGNDSITKTILKGSIGIGTTNPDSANLEIYDTSGYALYANGLTIGGVGTPSADDDAANKAYVDDAASAAADTDWTISGSDMYSGVSGNVGIGTNSPAYKLDIVGKLGLDDGGNSVFIGTGAGANDDGSWNSNIGIGYESLNSNTTGYQNVAVGQASLSSNVGGRENVALGYNSLYNSISGIQNTAIGQNSLFSNTTGYYNTAIGFDAGRFANGSTSNQASISSVYLGHSTKALASGDENEIVIGYNTTGVGSNSVVLGNDSITKTILKGSIGIGTTAPAAALDIQNGSGHSILAGSMKIGNVATPVDDTDAANKAYVDGLTGADTDWTISGSNMYSGVSGNVGIGTNSPAYKLDVVGKIGLDDGGGSVFLGSRAGNNDDASANRNVGIGSDALSSNTTGNYNIAVGFQSLYFNTAGFQNIANGAFSLFNNTTGYGNTAIGHYSLNSNTTGSNNIGIGGYHVLYSNTTGSNNIASGYEALRSNTTGSNNIGIGYQAGRYIADGATGNTTGDYNIFLGFSAKALADNDQNEIVIGYNAIGLGSNSVVLGNDSITKTVLKGSIGIGTTAPAAALDVQNGSGHSILAGSMKIGNVATPVDDTDAANKAYVDGLTGADTDWTISGSNMYSGVSGNVGIGTNSPQNKLQIGAQIGTLSGFNFTLSGDDGTIFTQSTSSTGYSGLNIYDNSGVLSASFQYGNPSAVAFTDEFVFSSRKSTTDLVFYQGGASSGNEKIRLNADGDIELLNGNVGIGTTDPGIYKLNVNGSAYIGGNLTASGSITSSYGSDFAEEFITNKEIEEGTVVVMGDIGYKSVKESGKAYDTSVVGVVSDNASIITGKVDSKNKAVIAMVGVVSVKVVDDGGIIKRGDLLTTSNVKGHAMKADKFVGGTIIGKALENMNREEGVIKVLINLQ